MPLNHKDYESLVLAAAPSVKRHAEALTKCWVHTSTSKEKTFCLMYNGWAAVIRAEDDTCWYASGARFMGAVLFWCLENRSHCKSATLAMELQKGKNGRLQIYRQPPGKDFVMSTIHFENVEVAVHDLTLEHLLLDFEREVVGTYRGLEEEPPTTLYLDATTRHWSETLCVAQNARYEMLPQRIKANIQTELFQGLWGANIGFKDLQHIYKEATVSFVGPSVRLILSPGLVVRMDCIPIPIGGAPSSFAGQLEALLRFAKKLRTRMELTGIFYQPFGLIGVHYNVVDRVVAFQEPGINNLSSEEQSNKLFNLILQKHASHKSSYPNREIRLNIADLDSRAQESPSCFEVKRVGEKQHFLVVDDRAIPASNRCLGRLLRSLDDSGITPADLRLLHTAHDQVHVALIGSWLGLELWNDFVVKFLLPADGSDFSFQLAGLLLLAVALSREESEDRFLGIALSGETLKVEYAKKRAAPETHLMSLEFAFRDGRHLSTDWHRALDQMCDDMHRRVKSAIDATRSPPRAPAFDRAKARFRSRSRPPVTRDEHRRHQEDSSQGNDRPPDRSRRSGSCPPRPEYGRPRPREPSRPRDGYTPHDNVYAPRGYMDPPRYHMHPRRPFDSMPRR